MYRNILVPTDGSDAARRAAEHAVALARDVGATVHAVYVVDESAANMLLSSASMSTVLDELTEQGRDVTAEVSDVAGDVPVETEVARGTSIADVLLSYAEQNAVDLVVMGTHGRRGLDHLLGSTTERVLARADVPTLVVPLDAADGTAADGADAADDTAAADGDA